MSDQGDDSEQPASEKPHEPTERKLQQAREKGDVARSTDLTATASYAGLLLVATGLGGWSVSRAGETGAQMIARADRLAPMLTGPGGAGPAGGLMGELALALSPWMLVPAAAVLLTLAAQRVIIFVPSKLAPKANRVSPVSNLGQKLGRSGLFEFAKSAAKLFVIAALMTLYLIEMLPRLISAAALPPAGAAREMGAIVTGFLFIVLAVQGVIAAADYLWQAAEHRRKLRMSHKEVKDETKSEEGDPHLRERRRAKGQEIVATGTAAEIRDAAVVVTNPSHYAVALKWRRGDRGAPVCVAKGTGELAARIRTIAEEAGVPVHRDPPTARSLYAAVPIGAEIRPEHYRAVAAAIRFSEEMRTRARAGWR